MSPAEDILHQGMADELFLKKQGEELMGKDFLDDLVMETTDTVKSTLRAYASFGDQDMDMAIEADAIIDILDHGHHSGHKLRASG